MKILTAEAGKIFAYKDEQGNEIPCGEMLYLGKNDKGERFYQIDKPAEVENGD